MAEPLAHEAQHGSGHNVLGGIDRELYFELLRRYETCDEAIAEAVGDRKSLRAEIKGLGIPLRAWDRARRDGGVSGEKREAEERAYLQMMAWQLKPSGFQAAFDLDPGEHELAWIERQGLEAGRDGHRRDSNSFTPGTEAYTRWDAGWLEGAGTAANGEAHEEQAAKPKRGPGRPRKKKADDALAAAKAHLEGDGETVVH